MVRSGVRPFRAIATRNIANDVYTNVAASAIASYLVGICLVRQKSLQHDMVLMLPVATF